MKYQIAIIGGGPAGYTAAEAAGRAGLSVVLFEKEALGGVCLNQGCIPTKTLLYSAKVYDLARQSAKYGVSVSDVSYDLTKIISRKAKVVRKLVLGIKARLTAQKVKIVEGEAYIENKHTVRCGEELYECQNLLICTGSQTVIPPIPGIDSITYWTHREALDNKEVPQSLVVVGGGVIGMEFASFFCSLGTEVTVVEMMDEILNGIDGEIASALRAEYAKKGIKFLLGAKVTRLEENDGKHYVFYQKGEENGFICADKLLMSVGRKPVMEGLGLENLNLRLTQRGLVEVDNRMQTSEEGVYVCGDLNGKSLLAHTAVKEAEVAVRHILGEKEEMHYEAIPGVVYTNPEVASVGYTEEALQAEGIAYRSVKFPMTYSGRFVAENEGANGIMKVLVDNEGIVRGVHMLGNPASELIVLGGMMIEKRATLSYFKQFVFPHPTVGELFRDL